MKKLFLLTATIIFIGIYINFSSASMPVAMEKKVIYDGNDKSMADIMPAITVMT